MAREKAANVHDKHETHLDLFAASDTRRCAARVAAALPEPAPAPALGGNDADAALPRVFPGDAADADATALRGAKSAESGQHVRAKEKRRSPSSSFSFCAQPHAMEGDARA
jgi:hypothetical protein